VIEPGSRRAGQLAAAIAVRDSQWNGPTLSPAVPPNMIGAFMAGSTSVSLGSSSYVHITPAGK
jgi:hypothetical protein